MLTNLTLSAARASWVAEQSNATERDKANTSLLMFLRSAIDIAMREHDRYTPASISKLMIVHGTAGSLRSRGNEIRRGDRNLLEALDHLYEATEPQVLRVMGEGGKDQVREHFETLATTVRRRIGDFQLAEHRRQKEGYRTGEVAPVVASPPGAVGGNPEAARPMSDEAGKLWFVRNRQKGEDGNYIISEAEWDFEARRELRSRAKRDAVILSGSSMSCMDLDFFYPIRRNIPMLDEAIKRVQKRDFDEKEAADQARQRRMRM